MRICGSLDPFFETGTEGVLWSVMAVALPGYDSLFVLKDGDQLRIYGEAGAVTWEGTVQLEYQRRHRPYPGNPSYGQQEIQGFWVHGFQADLSPQDWAQPFFEGAPAVAWVKVPSVESRAMAQVADHLDAWAQDPAREWAWLTHALGERSQGLGERVAHGLSYRHEQLGWSRPPAWTDAQGPIALLTCLAVDQAKRALWQPGLSYQERWDALRRMWPQPPDDATLRQWAAFRFPQDDQPIRPRIAK